MATFPEVLSPIDQLVDRSQVAVVIPTCNAAKHWSAMSGGLRLQGFPPQQVLIVDSSSNDETRKLAKEDGYPVYRINRCDFNHGGTRRLAVDLVPWASVIVYLTQDAVLATPDAIDCLLSAFEDPGVAAAYGRQLPRPEADPIEAHARLFNYPPESVVRSFASRHTLGIKATFLSNSFAAYRVKELVEVGGFPSKVIMAEDAVVAGRLLLAGHKTAYVAEAQVYHSHPFTAWQEFRRYFDIGVFHRRESWLRESFGRAAGEGGRYVRSEVAYLARHSPYLLPAALLRTLTKALGYELGLRGTLISRAWSRRLSYHKRFWDSPPLSAAASRRSPTISTSEHIPLR